MIGSFVLPYTVSVETSLTGEIAVPRMTKFPVEKDVAVREQQCTPRQFYPHSYQHTVISVIFHINWGQNIAQLHCHAPATPSIHISDTMVELSDQITSLGVVMDSNLTFNAHITSLCKACNFHLRSLRRIRRSLTDDMAILIAVALVQSRLDYCKSLFFNMSCFNINKLQRVQNLAARLALNDWRSLTQQIVVKLHWLSIQSRIKFQICALTYKLLSVNL